MTLFQDWEFLEIVADVGIKLSSILKIPRQKNGRIQVEKILRRLRPPVDETSPAYQDWQDTVLTSLLDSSNGAADWFTRPTRIYPLPWDELAARLYEDDCLTRRIKRLAVRRGIARDVKTTKIDEVGNLTDESYLVDQPTDEIVSEVRHKVFMAILRNAPNWVSREHGDSWWGYCDLILRVQTRRKVNAEFGRPRTSERPDEEHVPAGPKTDCEEALPGEKVFPAGPKTNCEATLLGLVDNVSSEYGAQLSELFESLDAVERQVLELRFFEEKNRREVAQQLGLSDYMVAQCELRIRQRLFPDD